MIRARQLFAVTCLFVAAPAQQVSGEVLPFRRLLVHAEATGRVANLPADEGARVPAGELLAELHAPALAIAVGAARTRVELAEVQVKTRDIDLEIARRRLQIAERELKIAAEQLPRARAALDAAEAQAAQTDVLFEAGRVSSADVRQARLDRARRQEEWAMAGEEVKAAQDRVEVARLESQRAELAVVGATVDRDERRAAVDLAEVGLDATRVRSPWAATVHRVFVTPGELVVAGEHALLELLDLERVRVRFEVPVDVAAGLAAGARVAVRRGDALVPATIAAVDATVDPDTQTRGAEVVLDNADGAWLVGALVDVELRVD